MLFNSLEFYLFFIPICFFYFAIPHRLRWLLLLIASYFFYTQWQTWYIIILAVCSIVTYYTTNKMDVTSFQKRKLMLFICLSVNFGLLIFYKYFTAIR